MLVFCEECGKRYSFPPEKLEAGSGQFRCRECDFLMTAGMEIPKISVEGDRMPPSESVDPDCEKSKCGCNKSEIEKRF